jgi:hypothetical protein
MTSEQGEVDFEQGPWAEFAARWPKAGPQQNPIKITEHGQIVVVRSNDISLCGLRRKIVELIWSARKRYNNVEGASE